MNGCLMQVRPRAEPVYAPMGGIDQVDFTKRGGKIHLGLHLEHEMEGPGEMTRLDAHCDAVCCLQMQSSCTQTHGQGSCHCAILRVGTQRTEY